MQNRFTHLSGSIVGREHLGLPQYVLGAPNQDCVGVVETPAATVAWILDGVTSAKHSHMGTWMAGKQLRRMVPALVRALVNSQCFDVKTEAGCRKLAEVLADCVGKLLLDLISKQARFSSRGDEEAGSEMIREAWLFSCLLFVAADDWYCVIGLGDGEFEINGKLTVVRSREHCRPCVIAYALFPDHEWAAQARLSVLETGRTEELKSVRLMSDGLLDLVANEGCHLTGGLKKISGISEVLSALDADDEQLQRKLHEQAGWNLEFIADSKNPELLPLAVMKSSACRDDFSIVTLKRTS